VLQSSLKDNETSGQRLQLVIKS